jgi:hypothetical protein
MPHKTTCTKKTQSKYITRKSPAYSASDCKAMKKKGNDGNYYISSPDKNGTYKWVKTSTKTKSTKTVKNKTNKISSTMNQKEITMEEIQKIIKKNRMSKSGTKLELAKMIHSIVKMDKEFGTRHIHITQSEKDKISYYVSSYET